jgi:hypothetical protein
MQDHAGQLVSVVIVGRHHSVYCMLFVLCCLRKAEDQCKELVGSLQLMLYKIDSRKIDCLMSFMICYRCLFSVV